MRMYIMKRTGMRYNGRPKFSARDILSWCAFISFLVFSLLIYIAKKRNGPKRISAQTFSLWMWSIDEKRLDD